MKSSIVVYTADEDRHLGTQKTLLDLSNPEREFVRVRTEPHEYNHWINKRYILSVKEIIVEED